MAMDDVVERQTISPDHFRQILEVSRMLAVTTELDVLLLRIAEAATALLDCERASIFLHDPKTDQLCTRVALHSGVIRVPANAGIVGHVFKTNSILNVHRPYEDDRFNPDPDRRSGFVTRNLLTAPMVDLGRKPIGVIQAVNTQASNGFDTTHEALLQLLADQAGVAIQRYALQQEAMQAAYLRLEMELARQVQDALIPKKPPEVEGVRSIGWTKPASATGGDCFDLWKTSDGSLGIFVGDAAGHGLGPALVVSQMRTLVRGMCDVRADPHELLACANARLCEDAKPEMFVTAFIGFVSPAGVLSWSSAGHAPILLRRGAGDALATLEAPGPPLGIVPQLMAERVEPIELGDGGLLAIVSDGVPDARDPAGQMFDVSRLIETLDATRSMPLFQQLDRLRTTLRQWQGGDEPADDQTVVLVQRAG
jgi:phosphoserine phosphatase